MVNRSGWSDSVNPDTGRPVGSEREVRSDVASVAQMWVTATYDDLRRAGPDRGARVRGVLDRYVIPWFGPQTASVGDITYFMVHEWLLTLVGRGRSESDDRPPVPEVVGAARAYRELSLREAAEVGAVSVATVRRRWRDGELTGAHRDAHGYVRVPEPATAAL